MRVHKARSRAFRDRVLSGLLDGYYGVTRHTTPPGPVPRYPLLAAPSFATVAERDRWLGQLICAQQ